MKFFVSIAAALGLGLAINSASALELGAEDFAAARDMTCVLAQESLGYLSEDEYTEMAESVLADYTQEGGDIIYAQALGSFDGLMFGLASDDSRQVNARLQEYVASAACTRYTGTEGVSLSL